MVTVLSDTGQRAADLDEAAALDAQAAAERALADKQSAVDEARARAELIQAAAQLRRHPPPARQGSPERGWAAPFTWSCSPPAEAGA